jgi:ClpX C4-type zinc finger protein
MSLDARLRPVPIDPSLLDEATAARDRCHDLERELGHARADFCDAVRALHASGASLREIAPALGLSHQRVHQLVEGTGGGLWARLGWSRRVPGKPAPRSCSFCGVGQFDTRRLVAGPGVYICDGCVASATRVGSGSAPWQEDLERFHLPTPDDQALRCSFCGRGRQRVGHLVTGGEPPRAICDGCLGLCREVVGRARPPAR